jgi:GNAT superfamily N-acetyltransferase
VGAAIVGSVRLYLRSIRVRGRDVHCAGVGEVATRSSHRRCGVASALLKMAGESMRERGLTLSVLHTSSSPWLYQKHGWIAVEATSLLLPVGKARATAVETATEQHWSIAPLDIKTYGDSYELLHPYYAAVSESFDGAAVRGKRCRLKRRLYTRQLCAGWLGSTYALHGPADHAVLEIPCMYRR